MQIKHKVGSKRIEIVLTGNESPDDLADLIENIKSNSLKNILKTNPSSFYITYQTGYSESQLRRLASRGVITNPYKFISTIPKKLGWPSKQDPRPVKNTQKNVMEFVADETLSELELFESGEPEGLFSEYDLNDTGHIRIKKIFLQFLHESKTQKKL